MVCSKRKGTRSGVAHHLNKEATLPSCKDTMRTNIIISKMVRLGETNLLHCIWKDRRTRATCVHGKLVPSFSTKKKESTVSPSVAATSPFTSSLYAVQMPSPHPECRLTMPGATGPTSKDEDSYRFSDNPVSDADAGVNDEFEPERNSKRTLVTMTGGRTHLTRIKME